MAVHGVLVNAATVPESTRPYSIQSYLGKIEELIMKEINEPTKTSKTEDEEIPF
jgi:hypothetical protein